MGLMGNVSQAIDESLSEERLQKQTITLGDEHPALFFSDMHFGDGSHSDLFSTHDELFLQLLETRLTPETNIVFLGDCIDLPQAWTVSSVKSAHNRAIKTITRVCQTHKVIFIRGNHDWNVDYESLFPGSVCCERVIFGDKTLIWHGHQLDLMRNPALNCAKFKTYLHSFGERLTGRRLNLPLEYNNSWPNRTFVTLGMYYNRILQAKSRIHRRLGQEQSARNIDRQLNFWARTVLGDPNDQFRLTCEKVLGMPYERVISGHSHIPGVVPTPAGTYVNVGSWTGKSPQYGYWDGRSVTVHSAKTKREFGDEYYQEIPKETIPEDLFRWWTKENQTSHGNT
jgi:UDP-2,3-diacylglucosamine pyrophosphatase LpxH